MEYTILTNDTNRRFVNATTMDMTTKDTFMEKVEGYVTFKIAGILSTYGFPVLVPFGLLGNTLSFLVMIKPNNREMSTCIYMAAISLNDNLMMCMASHNWLVVVMKVHEWNSAECKIAAYLVLFGLQNTTFQVLAMTIDKFIAIKWPHRAATYSTPRRAKFITIGVTVSLAIYNIPHLFFSSLVGEQCLGYVIGGVITKAYSWINFVINAIIPFTMLIYMNYVIVKTIRQSRRMFGNVDKNHCASQSPRNEYGNAEEAKIYEKCGKSAHHNVTVGYNLIFNSALSNLHWIYLFNISQPGYSF